jgi:NADH-quinone oxidoreductase subunit F
MLSVSRVLDPEPVRSLAEYVASGGGNGLTAATDRGAEATIEALEASGLRGRGGAGFPTGTKWRTVAGYASPNRPATVVVNGAEGEPGSYKDRELLVRNPYRVLEGALIAAGAVGADRVIVAVKHTFGEQIAALRRAIAELADAGWAPGVAIDIVAGPPEYLFGEETGLLEVVDGRPPFPRVAPPYRHGADEIGEGRISAAHIAMAGVGGAAPTLANNVETLANVPLILANGVSWFQELGTQRSPGTIVCTVSGSTQRAGVGEYPMGTTLREVITELGGGVEVGATIAAVLSGVANAFIPPGKLDTALTYEDMRGAGAGLGCAGFIVFDDSVDLVAVAQGVAHFLSVESCGQCTPCKQDGLAIARVLERFCDSNATDADIDELSSRIDTVGEEARCSLAGQQALVAGSLLALFPEALARHLETSPDRAEPVTAVLIAPLTVVRAGGESEIDESYGTKQPDWTHDAVDSGAAPAERLADFPEVGADLE